MPKNPSSKRSRKKVLQRKGELDDQIRKLRRKGLTDSDPKLRDLLIARSSA